ncbi:MAG TPA: GTP cyclohydrolase I FolE [Actinomycetota bacterium]|nr:GTP cyclohydrolase I FolE [Actinomycetota bacterium]
MRAAAARRLADSTVDQPSIEAAVRTLLTAIGEDAGRPDLLETPARVARMYQEVFSGIGSDPAAELDVSFVSEYDELILLRDIPLVSFCEHHLLPFLGRAHVGYVPNARGQITGLSKLARVVEVAARRPQVQERLTVQIADALATRLEPRGVIVVVEAEHLCMAIRGVRKPGATMVTSVVRGALRTSAATREEAMRLIAGR